MSYPCSTSVRGGEIVESPLVSIVIPFRNPGCFFQEAIESVLNQTWRAWELFLVDDGSDDGSSDLARKYAEHSPEKIHYLGHQDGQGIGSSAARNLGIERAKGEFLAFLDADDIWLPVKLEHQIRLLRMNPEAGMVYGPTLVWYSWNPRAPSDAVDGHFSLGIRPDQLVKPPRMVELYLKQTAQPPGTCSVLMRLELVREVGGFESAFTGMYDDQVLFYRFSLRYPVFIERGSWDRYRQHPESCCHQAARRGFYHPSKPSRAQELFLRWVKEHLIKDHAGDSALQAAMNWALWPYEHPFANRVKAGYEKSKAVIRRVVRLMLRRCGYAILRDARRRFILSFKCAP